MIILPILTTSLVQFSLKGWENVLGGEKVPLISCQCVILPPTRCITLTDEPVSFRMLSLLHIYPSVVLASSTDGYQHSKGDKGFAQLTLLFGELIRSDVFSHNAYMCTLISRGELQPTPLVALPSPPRVDRRVQPSEVEPLDTEECVQEGDAQLGLVLPLAVSQRTPPKIC